MADASITQKTTVPPSPNGLMLRAKSMWQRKTRATESEDAQSTDCEAGQNKKPALKPLSYFRLYSEADSFDIFLIVVGTIGAIGAGAALPGFTLVFGDVINSFNPSSASVADVNAAIVSSVNDVCLNFVYIAAASLVASYLEVAAWMVAGLRQANRIRQHFLRSALRQEVAYYDTDANTGVLLQGLNEDTNAVQNAIGEKVGQCLHHLATFVGGIAIAFWKGWKLTLVMIACVPALMICGALLGTLMGKMSTRANNAYGRANSIVQQALGGIRTVMSFNAQTKTVATYRSALTLPQKVAVRQGLLSGCTMGLIMLVMYGSYALALWYGATRIIAGEMNGGDVLTVLFAVLMGSFSLGQAAPLLQHFVNGKTAGARVWAVINRVPAIADDPASQQPARVTGRIELQNVGFSYPARRDIQIFSTLNMNINSGETVALVGESGSGKSTVVSLIMRFYDPSQGIVKLDGVDIRSLPLGWLRRQIGLVSQEPCLFQTSIFNNIKYGLPDATAEQVYAASRAANAHVFIKNLPDGYDTHVGEKGTQMSGGQKQRIALARAILRDPKILLLDEATSALDTVSERVVQKALEKLMPGRTTVVVAHRLSTIRPFRIAVMKAGKVVEVGTHSELLANQSGAYSTLVRLQNQRHAAEEHVDEEPVTEEDIVTEEHAVGSRRVLSSFQQKNDVEADEEVVPAGRRRCLPWKRKKAAEAEAKKEPEVNVSFARLLKLNKPELPVAILGCLASAVLGAQMPAFSIALSSIITVFYESFDSMRSSAAKWAGIFCAIGVGTFLGSFVQQAAFAFMGAKLARRIRVLTFSTILRQELSWFDDERHASGAVSTRLANDASSIRGAASDQLGLLVQNLVTVVGSLVIAFIYGPAMTGVVLSVVPLLGLAGWFQAKFMTGFSSEADTLFSTANQMAQEGISNIRTCQAFAMEVPISSLYRDLLRDPTKSSERRAHVAGAGFGFSQGCMFAVYALAFWFGAKQVSEGKMTFEDVLKVFFAVLLMALGVSQSTMAFPDVTKAKSAIQNVFTLVDTPPCSINVDAPGEEPLKVSAHIELVSVSFSYPSRPNVQVFRDFSLNVPAGATVALVGPSGSGKSTVVSLVQRFYDPTAGQVLFDGVHIRTLQLKWLRSHIGVVSQEPVLFSTSIADNILFGNEGASMEDVAAAAKAANAGFVLDLPEGFNTQVGEAGIQLSGGQKQRIAIARALIKNPRVLLLDEATSALDAESEAAVQVALNAAAAERTTIIVAHRLSTIRNATSIAVVQDGHILEEGTHSELMALGGSYTQLVRHQAAS